MQDWPELLTRPAKLAGDDFGPWFARVAAHLLGPARLRAGGEPHRLTEVEFYFHSADHRDVFAHRDPVQVHRGRWYFHRTRGVYRGGSFKGLDLTFGSPAAHAGILFRGLERADGTLIDGPSLLVDHLLARTGHKAIASLDRAIGGRLAWDADNPLSLETAAGGAAPEVLTSSRVGLSMKRLGATPDAVRFVCRRYRSLTEPLRIKKGKLQLVLALHAQGKGPEEIRRLTGSPARVIQGYVAAFEAGRGESDFAPYAGVDLSTAALARLHGLWHETFG